MTHTHVDDSPTPAHFLPSIPALNDLKAIPQWVAWRYEERNGNRTKPPINPHTGGLASTADRSTWGSYEQAIERVQRGGLAGVGFVLSEDDNLTGYDFDKCRNPTTGYIKPWAKEILGLGETYAEVSPSGTGIRLWGRGKLPAAIKYDPAKVEMYSFGRFLTVTGQQVGGAPDTINAAPRTKEACRDRVKVHSETWTALKKAGPKLFNKAPPAAPSPSENNVVGFPERRKRGVLWRAIYRGNTSDPFWGRVNSAALQNLSAWVPALLPTAKPSNLGYRVSSADLGRDLEEDLSITPQGIKDFGVYDMGDPNAGGRSPIDLVIEWGLQDTHAEAALWLCDRLGIDPKSLGWRGGAQPGEPQQPARLIKTSAEFADFIPPDYLIDGLMIRGYLYSCTALTGGGKTAIAVLLTAYTSLGRNLGDMEIGEPCRVLYFAGENAMDVKMRWVAMCGELGIDPANMNVRFVDRVLKFSEATKEIIREVGDDEYGLIIIDTSAAYTEGDDENNNKQLLDHAKRLRALTELPGSPTVFVCTHPVKSGDNLLPRGGGAFLNEVDGNFTLKNAHGTVEMHWAGKIRGPDFDAKHFRLKTTTHPKLVDSKGRLLMTVLAEPVTNDAAVLERQRTRADEDVLLVALKTTPGQSFSCYAERLGWKSASGVPDKKRASRAMDNLIRDKLVERHRGKHRLTPKGQKEVA